jgi:hypothetical protein
MALDVPMSLAMEHGGGENNDIAKAIFLGQRGMRKLGLEESKDLVGQFTSLIDKETRMELPDANRKFTFPEIGKEAPIGQVISDLPEYLQNIKFKLDPTIDSHGRYTPADSLQEGLIRVNPFIDDQEGTALHELQHAIQQKDFLPSGGSVELMWDGAKERYNKGAGGKLRQEIRDMEDNLAELHNQGKIDYKEYKEMRKKIEKKWDRYFQGIDNMAYEDYLNLIGEAEARMTAGRYGIDPKYLSSVDPISGAYYDKGVLKNVTNRPMEIEDYILRYPGEKPRMKP